MSRRSPRVKARATAPRLNDVGTLNPVALDSSMFQHQSLYPTFDEVSELSTRASDLKSEIARLRRELDSLTTSESQTKFTKFQKTEMDFEKKLQERDQELDNFAKFLTVYRVDSNPTFVEVEALQSKRNGPIFDAINASLLVSNPQRGFFRKNDIQFQNEELKGIIGEQEKVLRLLEARLKLFSSFQSANTAQFTVESLRRGMTPTFLGGRTPTKFDEISTKHRALSNELAALVRERRSLTQKRVAAKLVRRRRRERVRMTLSAQNSASLETPISQAKEQQGHTEDMERPSCENDVTAEDCGCKETNEECTGAIEQGEAEANQVCSNAADIDGEQSEALDELPPGVLIERMDDGASHRNETNDKEDCNQAANEACDGIGEATNELPRKMAETHESASEVNECAREGCETREEAPPVTGEAHELTGDANNEATDAIEETSPQESTEIVPEVPEFREDVVGAT